MSKIKLEVIKPWVTERTTSMLNMEDDVIVEYIFNQLEAEQVKYIPFYSIFSSIKVK